MKFLFWGEVGGGFGSLSVCVRVRRGKGDGGGVMRRWESVRRSVLCERRYVGS